MLNLKVKMLARIEEHQISYLFILATLVILSGILLMFFSFWVDPTGVIHNSVLIAIGEIATFSGSLLGIDTAYSHKMKKIREENKLKQDESV